MFPPVVMPRWLILSGVIVVTMLVKAMNHLVMLRGLLGLLRRTRLIIRCGARSAIYSMFGEKERECQHE